MREMCKKRGVLKGEGRGGQNWGTFPQFIGFVLTFNLRPELNEAWIFVLLEPDPLCPALACQVLISQTKVACFSSCVIHRARVILAGFPLRLFTVVCGSARHNSPTHNYIA